MDLNGFNPHLQQCKLDQNEVSSFQVLLIELKTTEQNFSYRISAYR